MSFFIRAFSFLFEFSSSPDVLFFSAPSRWWSDLLLIHSVEFGFPFSRGHIRLQQQQQQQLKARVAAGRAPWELAVPIALAVPLSGNPWCTASFSEPTMTASPSGSPSEVRALFRRR